jgi:hypothetical protein
MTIYGRTPAAPDNPEPDGGSDQPGGPAHQSWPAADAGYGAAPRHQSAPRPRQYPGSAPIPSSGQAFPPPPPPPAAAGWPGSATQLAVPMPAPPPPRAAGGPGLATPAVPTPVPPSIGRLPSPAISASPLPGTIQPVSAPRAAGTSPATPVSGHPAISAPVSAQPTPTHQLTPGQPTPYRPMASTPSAPQAAPAAPAVAQPAPAPLVAPGQAANRQPPTPPTVSAPPAAAPAGPNTTLAVQPVPPPAQDGPKPAGRRLTSWLRLHIGAHAAARDALADVEITNPPLGLVLGHDRNRNPVHVRLFREEATRATLVGGMWAARLLAFRALSVGARIVVFTASPADWHGFGRWATGRDDRVAIMAREQAVTVKASAGLPTLLIYDVGLSGPAAAPVVGPWQTQLTVLRQLTAYGFPPLQASNLLLLQRLAQNEASSAATLLRLDADTISLLQRMPHDMLALLGAGAGRYLWTSATDIERQHLGAPTR